MELLDAIRRRKTTNGAFLPDAVSEEHQRILLEAAGRAPSQLNSQPWRFVVIEDRGTIADIARISGESMTEVMSNGTFFERYKPYFRFSQAEMDEKRSGMLFDKLPAALRPFTGQVFTKRGQKLMNALGVPKTLGAENRKLVAGSPLLLGVMLDRGEYRPGQLSSFYSVFSMGAAMENIWLTTVELGIGIQFISFPMEAVGGDRADAGCARRPGAHGRLPPRISAARAAPARDRLDQQSAQTRLAVRVPRDVRDAAAGVGRTARRMISLIGGAGDLRQILHRGALDAGAVRGEA